ncbi:extracellular solute-binding protein [Thalassobacillus devorans]|uniref:extracellular solute-binding protein n=1 Tax=Thalassobacillus devorans TaxID=279813 RepID=UPI000A1C9C06|nr:extracellular solute-binding protein [Thalassobacillus devorans]
MKISKRWLFGIVFLAFFMVGCSSDSSGEDAVDLNWASPAGYTPQSPVESDAEYISEKVSEFEEENPDVNLNVDVMANNVNEAMARLMEQAESGRAPDLAAIDGYILPNFYDHLQPLDDLMEEYGIDPDDYLPFAKDVVTGPDGKIYGLYMNTDTRVLFYDTDVIPEPPSTWDEVIEVSTKIQEEGYNGLMLPGGRGEGTSVTTLWPLFWAQGGELTDDDGNPTFGEGENREKMLNVLTTIQEAAEAGAIPQRVSSYGAEGDLDQEVATGKTAMFLGGNWQETVIPDLIGEEEFESWDVAPLPQIEEGTDATSAGGWTWGIFTEDEEKQRAAFDLMARLYMSDQGMGEFNNVFGGLPSRESVFDSEYYKGTKFSDEYREMLEEAQTRPPSPEYSKISTEMQIAISEVISGGKTPEQALDDAWNSVNN